MEKRNLAALRVFRALLRAGKNLGPLKQPLEGCDWGTYTHIGYKALAEEQSELAATWFPDTPVPPKLEGAPQYSQIIKASFRSAKSDTDPVSVASHLDYAFYALRLLNTQRYLGRCSSTTTTEGVSVDVTAAFDKKAMRTTGQVVSLFTYRVRVTNKREQPIKVVGRSWTIKDASGQVVQHVPLADNAVVGQKPVIHPGACFEYCSGTDIADTPGMQSGSLLIAVLGKGIDKTPTMSLTADISPFKLELPAGQTS